jgi:hypothetical protein
VWLPSASQMSGLPVTESPLYSVLWQESLSPLRDPLQPYNPCFAASPQREEPRVDDPPDAVWTNRRVMVGANALRGVEWELQPPSPEPPGEGSKNKTSRPEPKTLPPYCFHPTVRFLTLES